MIEAAPSLADAWIDLPRTGGAPPVTASLRSTPADFRVTEDLGVRPDGHGEHLWLRVRKTGWNTADVATWLADAFGRPVRDVTWAGLKDRHAVAEQWFGVRDPGGPERPRMPACPDGIAILACARNTRKLRTGMLRGNRFRLVLREVEGDTGALARRLATIAWCGVPNYVGAQRFGRDGGNLGAAWRLLDGMPVRNRHRRGLLLSAARSFLFNQVVAARVRAGAWRTPLPGDLMTFPTSGSLFPLGDVAPGDPRLATGDLHPSGPLPGRDGVGPGEAAGALESEVLAAWPGALAGLRRLGLAAGRRSLAMVVRELHFHGSGDDRVIGFWLPAGGFATAVLRECCCQRARSST